MGRRATPTYSVEVVLDAVWRPDTGLQAQPRNGVVSNDEAIICYFRSEVLPGLVGPSPSEGAMVIAAGRWFRVDSVAFWAAGGFWRAKATLVPSTRSMSEVAFGQVAAGSVGLPASTLASAIRSAGPSFAPQRSLRFSVADAGVGSKVGVFWADALQQTDAPRFKAVDAAGEAVDLVADYVTAVAGGWFALLPRYLGHRWSVAVRDCMSIALANPVAAVARRRVEDALCFGLRRRPASASSASSGRRPGRWCAGQLPVCGRLPGRRPRSRAPTGSRWKTSATPAADVPDVRLHARGPRRCTMPPSRSSTMRMRG
jgi:hypothetical protein